ncbi:hypothetical protein J31TS6_04300 [Brevibacillus reuszeri]|uniref:hypothetical protein n=1 Tax=Brevibacillus reuszeri TaxID=54915 RepID=UPI001B0F9C3D|nr:hypothetical protein [Brevibacillus reuszeri]GIO04402.1 hypothetical protein J31TS6_04300 [Brevibacillus reuszeri]
MPSQDKQIIWDELQDFPEQVLSGDRNEKILENIREERRKMLSQQKQRKYLVWVANGLVTCALFFVFIWMKPFSFTSETTGSTSNVDQAYSTAAQKAIEAVGITKKFQFNETEQDADFFVVRTKNREAIVTFLPNTKDVRTVSVILDNEELPEMYQSYANTAQAAFQEAKQDVHIEQAHLFQDTEGTTLSFYSKDPSTINNQHVSVDVKTNEVTSFSINYQPADVDQKVVSIAQKSLMHLSNNKSISFTEATKSTDKKEEVWTLSNSKDKYSVKVGATSGKIYYTRYVSDYKIKSIHEAISVTKPLIQNIFGLDITGYTAYGGRDWGGYVLKQQGKPEISVTLESLDIGNISNITVKW